MVTETQGELTWTEINSEAHMPEPGIPVLMAMFDMTNVKSWFVVDAYWSESAAAWLRTENNEPLPRNYLEIAWCPKPASAEVDDFLRQMCFR